MADVVPLRQPPPSVEPPRGAAEGVSGPPNDVTIGDDGSVQLPASDGTVVTVDADGGVTLGAPAVHSPREGGTNFDANLAQHMDDQNLSALAADLLQGIEADNMSRQPLVSNYNKGIELLGLKIEEPSQTRTQKRNVSKIGNPLLLGACVEYQSSFMGEMLPAAGPAKVQNMGGDDPQSDTLARDFETDFNYYLTTIAKEYYPDTDRMAFYQAFGGSAYKKVYRCPVRRRPVSEAVYLPELIVSENATDLDNAIRVTHETSPFYAELKRMQVLGRYLNIDLGQPQQPTNQIKRKEKEAQGLAPISMRPQDIPYTLYETDAYIDPAEYGLPDSNAPAGLPLPFKITVAKDSQRILAVHRNWKPEDNEAFLKRNMYVPFDLVRGMGFYGLGFLQLLGNQTRALRAIWRLLVDAGMFSNFPGGFKAKSARTSTNELAPGPGEWIDIDIPADKDLKNFLFPNPYKPPDAVFIQLAELIQQSSEALGAKVKLEVGDGRTNVPVGTIMAMIEQQTQVMAAVHKRNHKAQGEELLKLRELFAENPQDLWRLARKPARKWEVAAEFMDLDLVPRSDPNIPSQIHRIMQAVALFTIATNPAVMQGGIMPLQPVVTRILNTINVNDVNTLVHPPQQQGPNPAVIAGMAKIQDAQQKNQIAQQKNQIAAADLQNKQTEVQREAASAATEAQQREQDRQSEERIEAMRQDTERMRAGAEMQHAKDELAQDHAQHADNVALELHKHNTGLAQQAQQAAQRGFGGDQI